MKSAKRLKKVTKRILKAKFKISTALFIMAKKIKNNFVAYYLILANASPRKLAPYYYTFIYTLIRKIARPIIKLQLKASRIEFAGYLPSLSRRGISAVLIIALIFVQVMNVGAFEAHVINVTATIVNDIPQIQADSENTCSINGAVITITTDLAGAGIVYTTNGDDPVCPSTNIYTIPFTIYQTATVKARTCHDGKQSAIAAKTFQVRQPAPETCDEVDNNCDGTIDNVYETIIASGTPNLVRLNNLYNDTASNTLTVSDDIYTTQSSTALLQFIYLNWVFPEISATEVIASSTLYLEHHETKSSATLEWWNGLGYQEVCFFPSATADTIDNCNLNEYLITGNEARNAAFRLKVGRKDIGDTQIEALDWAKLDIQYTKPVDCGLHLCGNGASDAGETCDDGNQLSQDGCSSTCQIEPATSCVKINEVYYDVASSSKGVETTNEWIELYNACGFTVNINNWIINDNTGTSTITQDINLASHNFAVISPSSTTWTYWNIPAEAEKIVLADSSIGGGLSNTGDRIILKDNNEVIADQMSYGNDDTVFNLNIVSLTSPNTMTTDGKSVARIVKGIDTDTATDWAYIANSNPGTNPHNLTVDIPIINQVQENLIKNLAELITENEINLIAETENLNPVIEDLTTGGTENNNQADNNLVEVENQEEKLITEESDLNIDENADLPAADENIEPEEPAPENNGEEEILPDQEIIESGDESASLPEETKTDQETAPVEEKPTIIEAPQEPATEEPTQAIGTQATPNSENTTL